MFLIIVYPEYIYLMDSDENNDIASASPTNAKIKRPELTFI